MKPMRSLAPRRERQPQPEARPHLLPPDEATVVADRASPRSGPIIPRLLRTADVETRTGIDRQSLYRACATGLLPHIRIGRSIYFSEEAIADFFARGGSSGNGGGK